MWHEKQKEMSPPRLSDVQRVILALSGKVAGWEGALQREREHSMYFIA